MAGLTPLTTLLPAVQGLTLGGIAKTVATSAASNLVRTRLSQNAQIKQLQQRQASEQGQYAQRTALEKQQLQINSDDAEVKRRAALKRAVARSQASFAGRGISVSGGGSSDAILLGLFDESEQERITRQNLDRIRETSLDQNLENNRRQNLLATNQLRERQIFDTFIS